MNSDAWIQPTPPPAPGAARPELRVSELPSLAALDLERSSKDQLEAVFRRGHLPDLADLAGWEFRGMNVPWWAKLAGIKKFIKGFYTDLGHGGVGPAPVMGYNCPVVQDGIANAWQGKPTPHMPKRFGFYEVYQVDAAARDNNYLNAVLLDYGRGGNPGYDPSAGLRDYLVQVEAGNPNLFLGKAYYAVGPARVATNFFILERFRRGLADYTRHRPRAV